MSAISAAVGASPGLTPEEVMNGVYSTGIPLALPANVCQSPPCADSHRASMCRAVTCAGVTGACSAETTCAPRPAYGKYGRPATVPDGPSVRSGVPLKLTGEVTGQPIVGCPPCALAVLAAGAESSNPADGTVSGTIDGQFFLDTGEISLENPSILLLGVDRREVANHSWTTRFIQGGPDAVSLGYSRLAVPTTAVLTWTGGSTQIYTQEIPVRYMGP
ncbi:MAG: hypothetical protein R3F14_37990 [Polyangiaceae bacterium]